jgi:hypothetical protein
MKLQVRLVIATAEDSDAVDAGGDASNVKETFHVREDVLGQVTSFDGDAFEIAFRAPEVDQ